jgi:hypothetical protein
VVHEEKPWWWERMQKKQKEKQRGVVNLAPKSYSFSYDV